MKKILDTTGVKQIIICILFFIPSQWAKAQAITIKETGAHLENVIRQIEKQCGCSFLYKVSELKAATKKVTINVNRAGVEQALKIALQGQPLTYTIVNNTIIIKAATVTEVRKSNLAGPVTGTVRDANGTLPGVTVKIDGTNIGVATNANGKYSVNLRPGKYRMIFSSIGYKTKYLDVTVGEESADVWDISLDPMMSNLQDAVVVGYTTKRADEITGSVQTFKAADLEGVTSSNFVSQLKGKVAGMYITEPSGDPNNKSTFVVRGQGTLPITNGVAAGRVTNNFNPLVVVDGIIYSDILNPSDIVSNTDIASITLLKDAASTAIYGSRASQGVLVITTKRGVAGASKVNVNSTLGISTRNDGKIKFMNSQELYDYQRGMLLNSYARATENLTQQAYLDKYLPNTSVLGTFTDWSDLIYRNGVTKTLDANLSGGNEKTRYYFGANTYSEEGALVGNKLERNSVKLNLDHAVSSKLSLSASLGAIFDKGSSSQINSATTPLLLPWFSTTDANGLPTKVLGNDALGNVIQNPVYDVPYNSNITNTQQLVGIASLKYTPLKWLTFMSNNSYNTTYTKNENYQDRLSISGATNKGSLTQQKNNSYSFMTSNTANARKQFGASTLGGLLGFEYNRSSSEYNALAVRNLPTGIKVPTAAAEAYPYYNGKSFMGERFDRGSYSLFAEADYNYLEKYTLNASYRMDYSTNFGIDNRDGHFYSISGAWLVSREKFFQEMDFLSNLRLRGSYGTSGKIAGEDFLTESFYNFGYQYSSDPAAVVNQLGNREITWEKAHVANIGIDLGLFNRIDITADLYSKRNTDLIQRVAISSLMGVPNQFQNIGAMTNKGLELLINTKNLVGGFKWETSFNISFNKNKVTKLYNGAVTLGSFGTIREGDNIASIKEIKWKGVDPATGNPMFSRLEPDGAGGKIEKTVNSYDAVTAGLTGTDVTDNFQYIGNSTPKYYGGLLNTFAYKNIELSVLLNFAADYLVYNNTRSSYFSSEGNNILRYNQIKPMDGQVIWQKPGDIATDPSPYRTRTDGAEVSSSRFWEDGSHIRLRNVRLTYNFPSSLISRALLKRANVFISGDNLAILTRKGFTGVDPEGVNAGNLNGYGIGIGYGASRKFMFGVQLSF